jgi:RNA polymerase sigma-70 factor (ECF subfamily)
VAAAQGGDAGALDALLRRHYDRIHAVARRLLCNDADAADAAQDACVAIARGIAHFDGRAAFGTWVYRVTTNACLDELRRRRRRPVPVDLAEHPPAGPTGGAGPPVSSLVDDRLEVDAALAQLAPELRAAVVLRDLCDLDYATIAEVLDIPAGTVRSRIARARSQLAALLGGEPRPTIPSSKEAP